jgi:hypothetical protein
MWQISYLPNYSPNFVDPSSKLPDFVDPTKFVEPNLFVGP